MLNSTSISFPIPTAEQCLEPAEEPFRSIINYSHLVTFPIYSLSLYLLHKEMSNKTFKNYQPFLIWHTCGNLIFELYTTILMVPVSYLSVRALRGTGLLRYWQVGGLYQLAPLIFLIYHTSFSVLELFHCRLKAIASDSILKQKLLRILRVASYGSSLISISYGSYFLPIVSKLQIDVKRNVYLKNPSSFPIELFCATGMVSPPIFDPIFAPWWTLIIVSIVFTLLLFIHTFRTLTTQLEKVAKHLSEKTLQMQRLLLTSLIIQTFVHGIMLLIPIVGFAICLIIDVDKNFIGYTLIVLISFHGSVSTVTMIFFTKPLHHGFVRIVQKCAFCFFTRKKPVLVITIDLASQKSTAKQHRID